MSDFTSPVLGLEGVTVLGSRQEDGVWQIEVELPLERVCPWCGGVVHRHGRLKQRTAQHTWVGVTPVRLVWMPVRGRCRQCRRTFSPRPARLRPWQRVTPKGEETALMMLQRQSFRHVAKMLGVHPATLRRLVDRVVRLDDNSWWNIAGDLVLSIDEHSFRGKDMLITVALRAPEKQLLTLLKDDRMRTLEAWFRALPEDVRSRIKVVTTDLKTAYRKTLARCCPEATVVPDPFHLVREMTAVLDDVRRLEQSESPRRPKIPRWPLVKGAEKLTPYQELQLERIQQDFPAIGALYKLKEDFRSLLNVTDPKQAEQALSRWLINADACAHAEGHMLANLIRRWRPNILHHWNTPCRWTNGYIEGLHTKIKLLKRASYGFRNRDRYRRKMLLGFVPSSTIPQLLT